MTPASAVNFCNDRVESTRPYLADYELGSSRKKQKSEIIFIERVWQLLKDGGRVAIVLPDGVLNNANTDYVRVFLLARFQVLAIVSLPDRAFAHYDTMVKASVVFLRKRGRERPNGDEVIFMATPQNIGYDATGRMAANDLPEVLSLFRDFAKDSSPFLHPEECSPLGFAIRKTEVERVDRLNADYFHPERLSVLLRLRSRKNLWCATLDEIAAVGRRRIDSPREPYIGLANVQSHTGDLIEAEEDAEGGCLLFSPGDILFCRLRPYLNKVYLATFEGSCSPEFWVLRVRDEEKVIPEYLAAVLRSEFVLMQTKHMTTGNTHPRLTDDDREEIVVPVPRDFKIQTRVAGETHRQRQKVRRLQEGIDDLRGAAKEQMVSLILGSKSMPAILRPSRAYPVTTGELSAVAERRPDYKAARQEGKKGRGRPRGSR